MSYVEDWSSMPKVQLRSFGYLHGDPAIPAHITIDARKLLYDPHTDAMLRELTGMDEIIRDKVIACSGAAGLITNMTRLIQSFVLQHDVHGILVRVDIGCSGGRHRSVVLVQEIAEQLTAAGINTQIMHRDVRRPVVYRQ